MALLGSNAASPGVLVVNTLLLVLLCWRQSWTAVSHSSITAPPSHAAQTRATHEPQSAEIDLERGVKELQPQMAELLRQQQRLQRQQEDLQMQQRQVPPSLTPQAQPLFDRGPAVASPSLPTIGAAATSDWLRGSLAESRLRQLWRLPSQPPGSRAAAVEVHNDSWALLSDRHISRGIVSLGDPLPMRCFASRLLAGQAARLSVVGGSVSFGTTFTTSRSKALFHWKVYQWLNATFPGAVHDHYCGAVPASGPSYMEHCINWHLGEGVNLILLEYAVNFDEASDDAASFERLLRKLLRLPSRPAVIIINTMELMPPSGKSIHFSGPKDFVDGYSHGEPDAQDMEFHFRASAEDAINQLAQYYAVPTVSLRNALFHELKAKSKAFPLKLVFHDRHHPGAWGHSLLAQMVIELIAAAVRASLADLGTAATDRGGAAASPACRALAADAAGDGRPQLGGPLISPSEEAAVGMCIKGEEIMRHVLSAKGFAFKIEGQDAKTKPGLIGTTPGDQAQLCLDVQRLQRGRSFVVILGHLISYEHMGMVRVECLGDCECDSQKVDAYVEGGKFSVFKAKTLSVKRRAVQPQQPLSSRPECGCALQLTILKETGSGEHKFKVLTLMTASHEGTLRYGHQTGFNVRPLSARIS